MNGFMLLVLVVMAGQVSPGGLTMPQSLNPVQPASMIADPAPNTDYGWQLNEDDGLLEYIIQISPERAKLMYENAKEQASTIPPIVASRIHRVVVRVGTKPIQSLALERVLQLPLVDRGDIAENLPAGRIKNLENSGAYDVQNVGGGSQPPPLATGGMGASLADAPTLQNDKLAETLRDPENALAQAGRGTPGSNFLQDAIGSRTGGATPSFPSAPGTNPYTAPNNSGMPTSTATTPPPGLSSSSTGLNPSGSVGMPGIGATGLGNNNTTPGNSNFNNTTLGSTTLGSNTQGGNGYGQPHSTATNGSYTAQPGQNNTTLSGTRPGFAAPPWGSTSTQLGSSAAWPTSTSNNGYNTPGYSSTPSYGSPGYNTPGYSAIPGTGTGNSGYANNGGYNQSPSNSSAYATGQNGSYLHSDPPSVRLAQNTPAVPGTSNANTHLGANRGTWGNDGMTDLSGQASPRTGMDNILSVAFVFSLASNVYLGMLIRKLLGRYRTLLASVRSQTV